MDDKDIKKVQQLDLYAEIRQPPEEKHYSYVLIDKRFLREGDSVEFDLFYHDDPKHMSLFLEKNNEIDKEHNDRLKKLNQLYTSDDEKEKYENFVEEHLQSIAIDERYDIDEKADIIYNSSVELAHSLYEDPEALENIKHSQRIITPILHTIIYNKTTIKSYLKILAYDYYTHTHSLNVSIYALALGRELGLDKSALTALGRAALLHDLGKSKIAADIVNKDGFLTPHEFQQMKMHPFLGYKLAQRMHIEDKNILDAIRHHHEKLDGSGYPDKLRGVEITLFPRILVVCDIFDALTTRRSYKNAMRTFDALSLMKKELHHKIDPNVFNTFIKMLHK